MVQSTVTNCIDEFTICFSKKSGILVSFSLPAAALFTSLTLNEAKSSILFRHIKRQPKAWWSAGVEKQLVKDIRLSLPLTEVMTIIRLTSLLPNASSVIAKAEAWQATCSFLSPKFNPRSVYSFLCSVAGSSSSPRELASVFANYLRPHFSVSQPKAFCSRAKGYLSELCQATCPRQSYLSFCCPFSPRPMPLGPDKIAYSMPKHLSRSGMDLLLYTLNLSWSLHSFPTTWMTSVILIDKIGKPLDSPTSFWPISLSSCVLKLFECIILLRLLFFL